MDRERVGLKVTIIASVGSNVGFPVVGSKVVFWSVDSIVVGEDAAGTLDGEGVGSKVVATGVITLVGFNVCCFVVGSIVVFSIVGLNVGNAVGSLVGNGTAKNDNGTAKNDNPNKSVHVSLLRTAASALVVVVFSSKRWDQ